MGFIPYLYRVDVPGGYIHGGSLKTYVNDYQGNVRQVVSNEGEVIQQNDYYPYGALFGESAYSESMASGNEYLFGAKQYLSESGANVYDFLGRYYDPATLIFWMQDPLKSKYPSICSYMYCNANPVMFNDPTGMKINFVGNDENMQKLLRQIDELVNTSQLFAKVYHGIEASDKVINIKVGDIAQNNDFHDAEYNVNEMTVTFNRTNIDCMSSVIAEESYHLYQHGFRDPSWPIMPPEDVNIEFEAHSFAYMVVLQSGKGTSSIFDEDWGGKCIDLLTDPYLSDYNVQIDKMDEFIDNYREGCREFIKQSIESNRDKNYKYNRDNYPNRFDYILRQCAN